MIVIEEIIKLEGEKSVNLIVVYMKIDNIWERRSYLGYSLFDVFVSKFLKSIVDGNYLIG